MWILNEAVEHIITISLAFQKKKNPASTATHFNTRQHLIFWFEISVPEQGQAS